MSKTSFHIHFASSSLVVVLFFIFFLQLLARHQFIEIKTYQNTRKYRDTRFKTENLRFATKRKARFIFSFWVFSLLRFFHINRASRRQTAAAAAEFVCCDTRWTIIRFNPPKLKAITREKCDVFGWCRRQMLIQSRILLNTVEMSADAIN